MKIIRLTAMVSFLVAMSAISVFAQGARPAGQAAPPAGGAVGPVPEAKIALINTAAFFDEKNGIARLNRAVDSVEREFQPKEAELKALQQDIIKKQDDLQKQAALLNQPNTPVNGADLQAKSDEIEQLKKDFQRKQQDAQDAFKKRNSEVQAPIIEDILKSLDAFAKQRGITLTLDGTKLPDAILTFLPSVEITDEFIKDYNSRNPATASIAKP